MNWTEETRVEHYFVSYGNLVEGYGSSMDPHICGDESEPCVTLTKTRKVTDWTLTERKVQP